MQQIEFILLGIIQGLTEFLPVSSSGHILMGRHLFDIHEYGMNIEVLLHLGTLVSILVFWYKDILTEFNKLLNGDKQFLFTLIIGTMPAAIIGLTLNDYIKNYFFYSSSINFLSYNYLLLAVIIFSSKFIKDNKQEVINYKSALLIGLAQAVAILPGFSRSGLTIVMAMYIGVSFKYATRFSFLLAIPILLFASIDTILVDYSTFYKNLNFDIFIGFLFSFITGYLVLGTLQKIIENRKFWYFSIYCFLISMVLFYVI